MKRKAWILVCSAAAALLHITAVAPQVTAQGSCAADDCNTVSVCGVACNRCAGPTPLEQQCGVK
jgi:hypothetical protein